NWSTAERKPGDPGGGCTQRLRPAIVQHPADPATYLRHRGGNRLTCRGCSRFGCASSWYRDAGITCCYGCPGQSRNPCDSKMAVGCPGCHESGKASSHHSVELRQNY